LELAPYKLSSQSIVVLLEYILATESIKDKNALISSINESTNKPVLLDFTVRHLTNKAYSPFLYEAVSAHYEQFEREKSSDNKTIDWFETFYTDIQEAVQK
jgi:hypothetical protein